jgi:RNA recognition motif-containing protein
LVDVTCHEGFGFVTVNGLSESEVKLYLSALKLDHSSRPLDVKLAVDRRIAKEIMEQNKDKKLLVNNLSKKIDNNELFRYFSQFGKLDRAYVAYDPKTRIHRNFGFVIFEDIEVAKEVLKQKTHFILKVKTHVSPNLLKNEYKDKKNMENSTKNRVPSRSFQELPVTEPSTDGSPLSPQRQHFKLNQHAPVWNQAWCYEAQNVRLNHETMS